MIRSRKGTTPPRLVTPGRQVFLVRHGEALHNIAEKLALPLGRTAVGERPMAGSRVDWEEALLVRGGGWKVDS